MIPWASGSMASTNEAWLGVVQVLRDPGQAEAVHVVRQRGQVVLLVGLGDREAGLALVAVATPHPGRFQRHRSLWPNTSVNHRLDDRHRRGSVDVGTEVLRIILELVAEVIGL